MWMNEGFTVFEERKVSERVHGEEFAKIEAQLGNVSLWSDMMSFGLNNSFSSLNPNLTDASPDDSFSEVPYEKGFQFITYMESLFDTKLDFENVLRYYINKHSQMSVTYLDFKLSLEEWLTTNYAPARAKEITDAIQWDEWVNLGGENPKDNRLNFTTEGAKRFEDLADAYIALGGNGSPVNFQIYIDTTDPQLKVIFLNRMMERVGDLNYKLMAKID